MINLKKLGPGLLYAAAAVGVSHLVQSTRAGASFGFALVWAVVLANIFKYPFFRIGPLYTTATNESLLVGYKKLGSWAVYLFFIMTFATMFTVQAAVTTVTAGIAAQFIPFMSDTGNISILLLVICSSILIVGQYKFLDNLIKIIIIVLTITTIFALCFALTGDFPKQGQPVTFDFTLKKDIFFLIALIGWMPAPLDLPIWHSMWTIAKNKTSKTKVPVKDSLLDFNIGFVATTVLALCFLSLGSLVMYDSGITFQASSARFAGQLIDLYTNVIGDWAYPLIVVCAFSTMFSTTLTCLDAFPRILREGLSTVSDNFDSDSTKIYRVFLIITVIGTIIILKGFILNMKALVDLATTLSFVIAPIYAYLNYKIMYLPHVPKELHPKGILRYLSYAGFVFLGGFCLYFLYYKFII